MVIHPTYIAPTQIAASAPDSLIDLINEATGNLTYNNVKMTVSNYFLGNVTKTVSGSIAFNSDVTVHSSITGVEGVASAGNAFVIPAGQKLLAPGSNAKRVGYNFGTTSYAHVISNEGIQYKMDPKMDPEAPCHNQTQNISSFPIWVRILTWYSGALTHWSVPSLQ